MQKSLQINPSTNKSINYGSSATYLAPNNHGSSDLGVPITNAMVICKDIETPKQGI
jgi:hypothetical protein